MRRFELVSESHSQYWEIAVDGRTFTVRFGKYGRAGQEQTRSFAAPEAARVASEMLIAEKIARGYLETTPEPRPARRNAEVRLHASEAIPADKGPGDIRPAERSPGEVVGEMTAEAAERLAG